MTSIIGIPTTRVSDLFVRQRLQDQMAHDQIEMFRLQAQLSTGHRIGLPSEDPVSAMRIVSLQRLLERKDQVQTNLATNQSFLASTDTTLSSVSTMIAEVRGAALEAIGTTATDTQRRTAAEQVQRALQQLVDTGNQLFRGRYLFSGSLTTTQPFEELNEGLIKYAGNEARLSSYSDIDLLFDTNLTGAEVFGALSEPVRGSADLNPILTYDTRLADLRGGRGITPGSLAISNGSQTSIVDISAAETIGDVAAMIRANPPGNSVVDVEITATGLEISLDAGNLSIKEVGGGTTARELGILAKNGVGVGPVVGDDLDPILRLTTQLDDAFGARARAVLRSSGADNDLIVEADRRGTGLNGVTISFFDDGTVTDVGNEVATYDAGTNTLRVNIKAGYTQARHVVDAIQNAYDPVSCPFTARLDPLDEQRGGEGLVDPAATAVTRYGSGFDFDQDSGIQIVNGAETYTLSFSKADGVHTVEDLLNVLNGSDANVLAAINEDATGIDVRSRLSGADFAIGENGGTTAAELGLRTFTADTRLEDLNFGRGVADDSGTGVAAGTDFSITRRDGVTFQIDLDGAETIGDVLQRINTNPDNLAAGTPLVARLAAYGNGIELVDNSAGSGTLTVTRGELSAAAIDLGLIPPGQESRTASAGQPDLLTGSDVNSQETEGLFTVLLRLQDGLLTNDAWETQRSIEMLDSQVLELNFSRAELGARQQGLDTLKDRLDSEDVELQASLSQEYDADLAETISNLTGRQTAFEASLRSIAQIFQMSLLNYL